MSSIEGVINSEHKQNLINVIAEAKKAKIKVLTLAESFGTLARTLWAQAEPGIIQSDSDAWLVTAEVQSAIYTPLKYLFTNDYTKAIRALELALEKISGLNWALLRKHLAHDYHHLNPLETMNILISLGETTNRTGLPEQENAYSVLGRDIALLKDTLLNSGTLARYSVLPIEVIENICLFELGIPISEEAFNLSELFMAIASLIQARFIREDFQFVSGNERPDPARNCIIIRVPDNLTLHTNKSMLFSIVYNLAKNAAKAMLERHNNEGDIALSRLQGYPNSPRAIIIEAQELHNDLNISVIDEGIGLSLDKALQATRNTLRSLSQLPWPEVVRSELYQSLLAAVGETELKLLLAWPSSDAALGNAQVKTILSTAVVAGLSGSIPDLESINSGMGLWSVRYFIERLKGNIAAINRYNGGAIFSLTLPKSAIDLKTT
jgi:signal transduction histidine kinase